MGTIEEISKMTDEEFVKAVIDAAEPEPQGFWDNDEDPIEKQIEDFGKRTIDAESIRVLCDDMHAIISGTPE